MLNKYYDSLTAQLTSLSASTDIEVIYVKDGFGKSFSIRGRNKEGHNRQYGSHSWESVKYTDLSHLGEIFIVKNFSVEIYVSLSHSLPRKNEKMGEWVEYPLPLLEEKIGLLTLLLEGGLIEKEYTQILRELKPFIWLSFLTKKEKKEKNEIVE